MKTSTITCIVSRSLLLLLVPAGHFHAKAEPAGQNPHAPGEIDPWDADAERPFIRINNSLTYQFEIFSLPKDHAATLLREVHRPGAPSGKILDLLSEEAFNAVIEHGQFTEIDLYNYLIAPSSKETVRLERLLALRHQSDFRAHSKHFTEHVYPMRYGFEPPKQAPDRDVAGEPATRRAQPLQFTSRPLGIRFDMRSTVVGEPPGWIFDADLRIEVIALAGRSTWGNVSARTEMPEFESRMVEFSIVAPMGVPQMLATMDPPVPALVVPEAEDQEERVWLLFLTAMPVSPH